MTLGKAPVTLFRTIFAKQASRQRKRPVQIRRVYQIALWFSYKVTGEVVDIQEEKGKMVKGFRRKGATLS